jgi:hypothetical protein
LYSGIFFRRSRRQRYDHKHLNIRLSSRIRYQCGGRTRRSGHASASRPITTGESRTSLSTVGHKPRLWPELHSVLSFRTNPPPHIPRKNQIALSLLPSTRHKQCSLMGSHLRTSSEHILIGTRESVKPRCYSTIVTVISIRSFGKSRSFFGRLTILSAMPRPLVTSPNAVYFLSRKRDVSTTMKN